MPSRAACGCGRRADRSPRRSCRPPARRAAAARAWRRSARANSSRRCSPNARLAGQFVALVREIEEFERAVDLVAGAARAAEPAPQKILAGAARRNSARPRDSARRSIARTGGCSGTCAQCPSDTRACGGSSEMSCAVEHDAARGQREQAADEIDDRALARAVRADQAENLRRGDRQIDAVDGAHAAEMLASGRSSSSTGTFLARARTAA